VPRLEPKDLYDRRIRRDHARLRAYNTLLEQIYNRVYATSQLSGNTSSVLYSVPPFILGLPKMDMEDCIVYLVWQLRNAGFEVRFTWPNLLFISWKHHETAYLTNQNPILKAMTPDRPRLAPAGPPAGATKGKKGAAGAAGAAAAAAAAQAQAGARPVVAFNQEIDIITGGRPPMAEFGTRRAMDYEPPASFIQNLERPGPGREQKAKGNVLADLWTLN